MGTAPHDADRQQGHAGKSGHAPPGGRGAGDPQSLVQALAARENLDDAEIVHIMTLGVAPYTEPRFDGRFRHNAFFIGANTRAAVAEGRADYPSISLSEAPAPS